MKTHKVLGLAFFSLALLLPAASAYAGKSGKGKKKTYAAAAAAGRTKPLTDAAKRRRARTQAKATDEMNVAADEMLADGSGEGELSPSAQATAAMIERAQRFATTDGDGADSADSTGSTRDGAAVQWGDFTSSSPMPAATSTEDAVVEGAVSPAVALGEAVAQVMAGKNFDQAIKEADALDAARIEAAKRNAQPLRRQRGLGGYGPLESKKTYVFRCLSGGDKWPIGQDGANAIASSFQGEVAAVKAALGQNVNAHVEYFAERVNRVLAQVGGTYKDLSELVYALPKLDPARIDRDTLDEVYALLEIESGNTRAMLTAAAKPMVANAQALHEMRKKVQAMYPEEVRPDISDDEDYLDETYLLATYNAADELTTS